MIFASPSVKRGQMTFKNRKHAGSRLAEAVRPHVWDRALVLAIPRGGVPVAARIHEILDLDMDMLISRKLPFPDNPESGFGAVAEDGTVYLIPRAEEAVPGPLIDRTVEEQKREIQRRIQTLRGGRKTPSMNGRQVILADDGIAMGSTMIASIQCCRNQGAASVLVTVPVCSPRISTEIANQADRLIALVQPSWFRAVAQVYETWADLTDEDVFAVLSESAVSK